LFHRGLKAAHATKRDSIPFLICYSDLHVSCSRSSDV